MRILHTSDWHIGRQFHGASLLDDQSYVLDEILKIINENKVEVLLIAGDIYDRSVPPSDAIKLLNQFLNQLSIPVVMIAGNHDGAVRLSFGNQKMQDSGVHIMGELEEEIQRVVISDEHGEVAFYGLPYAEPSDLKNVFEESAQTHDEVMSFLCNKLNNQIKENNDERVVVLSHCFIDGADECESERPLSVGGADRVSYKHFLNYDYTALGHLHGRQFKGEKKIRYSGTPMKYSFSEQKHIKSVTLVDLSAPRGEVEIEQIEVPQKRNMRILEGSFDEIKEASKTDPNKDDYLLIRITDKHAIMDLMSKLREIYPNTLHLERPGLMSESNLEEVRIENLKKSEMNMFKDFFSQVQDENLSEDQEDFLTGIIESVRRSEA